MLNGLRESLRDRAEKHARPDLAEVFGTTVRNWPRHGAAVLAALDQIEYLGEPRPTLTEPPQRWLPTRLAHKLPSARFPDFDALYQAMEAGGHFWWRGIPGLGATKAKAIAAWLTAREAILGRKVPKTVQEKPKRARVPVWARAASTVSTDDRTNALLPLERQTARGSPEWRPFAGPLSQRSQAQALIIVGSLCEWLVEIGYLLRNPFRGVPSRVTTPPGVKIQRAFNTALWRYLLDALDKREPPGERARRAWRRNRFLLYLGYGTGSGLPRSRMPSSAI